VKILDVMPTLSSLCIETAPFIYLVEKHPKYVGRMRSIIQYIDDGAVMGFSSTVTLTEVLTQPLKMGNSRLVSMYRDILVQSRNFTLVPINVDIAEHAADLRARYNLKTPDALQVAVALHAGCDAFLSNDFGLKRVTEVRVLILDELE
jgi:predicted nucleic acid-binding protein